MDFYKSFIVYIIIVITRTGHRCTIKIRISTNGCRRHKTTSGMPVHTHLFPVDKRIAISQLLYGIFIVSQRIIPLISIPVCMVSFTSHRRSASMSHGHHDKTDLSQTGIHIIIQRETCLHVLVERSRVYGRNNRVTFRRIKIRRFPHDSIYVRNTVCRFHFKAFRGTPSQLIYSTQIRFLQFHDNLPFLISHHVYRFQINTRITIHEITMRRRYLHVVRSIFRSQQSDRIFLIQVCPV